MSIVRHLLILLALVLVLGAARECHAVIYMYVDEKGEILYADDLQKVPPEKRSSAVMVSGTESAPEQTEAERAELAARKEAAFREEAAAREPQPSALGTRLAISLAGAGVVAVLLFVTANIDALKERRALLKRIRASLIAGLVVLTAVVHLPDLIGLFRKTANSTPAPLSDIQRQQEERGRKAAEAMKAFNRMLDQAGGEQGTERERAPQGPEPGK